MKENSKRILSLVLVFNMIFSMLPVSVFAKSDNAAFENDELSYFDFEASEYEVKENAGELKIKIVRHGDGDESADVAFKVVDFLSDYGKDYKVLDENGKALKKVYGEKPDLSEFVFDSDDETEDASIASEKIQEDTSEQEENFSVEEVTELEIEEEPEAEEEPEVEEIEDEEEPESEEQISNPVNDKKKSKSRGFSILDAQAKYLNMPDAVTEEEKEDAIEETLNDMYTYFLSAEGANGKVHFNKGEKEKYITIKILDNDESDENRVFMIALMGTDSENTTIAANSTTYVSIIDDEPVETACFDLVEDELVLTEEEPASYVTIERTSGTQYFSVVYLSTVTQTAKESSYDAFEAKEIAFVPGETEKTVEIKAYDFSEDAYFGLRLEGDSTTEIGNHYAKVLLSADDQDEYYTLDDSDASLMADDVTLGSDSSSYDVVLPGDWEVDKNGDGSAWESGNTLYIRQYDDGAHTMYVSKQKQNLVGVKNIKFSAYTTNPTRGFDTKYKSYTTGIETDSDKSFAGHLDAYHWGGNRNWAEGTLGLSNTGDDAYIKFWVKCNSGGYDNVESRLDWLRFNYAKYSFSPQNSAETISRKIYDFTSGTPNIIQTYFDGETAKLYNPGTVTVKQEANNVSAFYSNNDKTITISAANAEKNDKYGIYLKGVYFANNSHVAHSMVLDGKYTTSKVYYVEAGKDNTVVLNADCNFVKELKNSGVISNVHSDATIKIFPVFGQKTVTVNFENTDRDDSNDETKGKYDKDNLNSYLVNVLEANEKAKNFVKKCLYDNWLDYYVMTVPIGSVIRVQSVPASNRTPAGINWWYANGSRGGIVYYEKGKTTFSSVSASGDVIEETDYTKGDVVADGNICIKPATGEQTFFVGYSPVDREGILNVNNPDNPDEKLFPSLENVVIDTSDGNIGGQFSDDDDETKRQTSDADGNMWLKNPYIGKQYTITAFAPEQYYVSWVNMTGDTNNDGVIDKKEEAAIVSRTDREKSKNPIYLFGNKLNVTLDNDNTVYYYAFLPKTSETTKVKTGTVKREVDTVYNILHNEDKYRIKTYKPISGAWMNIAGFVAQTNTKGEYSVDIKGLPSWGTVSSAITIGESEYYAAASIEAPTNIILPALEVFTARETSAAYDKGGNVSDNFITVVNDKLSLSVSVSSDNALIPSDARFYVYNDSGINMIDCSEKTDTYKTDKVTLGDKFTATLTFNPKADIKFGYKIYVQFADQNGKWYEPIDLGYEFFSELDLGEFIFPLIGSSTLEGIYRADIVTDIIGDPLGDISIGTLYGFDEPVTSIYTPEAAKNTKDEARFTWQRSQYQFGWSDEFYRKTKTTDKDRYDDKLKSFLKDVYDGKEKSSKVPTPSKYATKSKFKWSVTPEVGFNLTLSQRDGGKNYFEDLVFYVRADFEVSSKNTIELPIGINIAIDVALDGSLAGVYRMYVDYEDLYETEDAVEYTSESFGLFKTFNNSVRREGYIFLDPRITVNLGVGAYQVYVKGKAEFDFDMDFQFTEIGTNAYGDITIDLGWNIELLGFEVYSMSLYKVTKKMFNTEGTNEHIDFNYANKAALQMLSEEGFDMSDGEFALDKTIDRAYLDNRSEWLGEDTGMTLMSVDASEGTSENVLMTGSTDNPYVSITKINDSEMLMVFVDDNPEREDVNKRTVYYSIGDGETWGEPVVLDNDGTLDDYPNVQDLGNGSLIVSWSSANTVHGDDADLVDVLSSLEIKTVFFDKESKTFGEVTQLTKTTDEDYTADMMPRASYDEETGRIILYYTKTEYISLEEVSDLYDENTAPSVIAYLFYQDGEWCNDGDVYTDDELLGLEDWEKDEYREQWYGQRFLDLRIDSDSYEMLRLVESDAICYNGLSIFAWTVDWDRNLSTINDRDVFIQIYNFEEESFTHNIRITSESGYYTSPKLARSNNATYLFFGAQEPDAEHGEICYLNITDVIKNDRLTLVSEGNTEYYVLSGHSDENNYELPDGSTETIPDEAIQVGADIAVESNNVSEYDVYVDENGKMYLFWTEVHGGARQIVASVYNTEDEAPDSEEEPEETAQNEVSYWSEAFVLSNGEENTYYTGIGAAVIDGYIYAGSAKGNYVDSEDTALVMLKHIPFENVTVTGVEIEEEYPVPGSAVDVVVTVTNNGLLQSSQPVTVSVDVDGNVVTQDYTATLPGGAKDKMYITVELPEEAQETVITAYSCDEDENSLTVEYASKLDVTDVSAGRIIDKYAQGDYMLTAKVENVGNANSDAVTVEAYIDEELAGSQTIDTVEIGTSNEVSISIDAADDVFTITDGVGKADIKLVVSENDEAVFEETVTVEKEFSAQAIELLSSLTDVEFKKSYSLKEGDIEVVQPEFKGVDENTLMVDWLTSSDASVAYIDYSNAIVAQDYGTTTLTGIVVPMSETFSFDASGNAQKVDWQDVIPEDMLMTVTATVKVAKKNSHSGSVSVTDTTTKYTVTFNTNGGNKLDSVKINKNTAVGKIETPVKEGYIFEGWYLDEALTKKADSKTTVTGNMTLYAKWIEEEPEQDDEQEDEKDDVQDEVAEDSEDVEEWNNPFTDVKSDDWFYENVKYANQNGLFNGTTVTTFSPNSDLTRAMLVTVLYRAEGEPEVEEASGFVDVAEGEYYADAVAWAKKNGIVNGMSKTEFAPDTKITREQITTIMFRYAVYKGVEAVTAEENLGFKDADDISPYAISAMNWIVGKEIIKGYEDGTVRPLNNATRAEAAAVLQRFLEKTELMKNVE